MPNTLAIYLCVVFIAWLWYRDHQKHPELSPALWLPVVWLLVLGSRPLSHWLGVQYDFSAGAAAFEGNAFDRTSLIIQILAGWYILTKRGIVWSEILRNNKTLFVFYAYLALTIIWADHPFVAFKRWSKDLGAIAILLIILTDVNPVKAMYAVFMRCAFVLLPLSVVFCKYLPDLGRSYTAAGGAMYSGVTGQKNSLGEIVLVFGLVIVWRLIQLYEANGRKLFNRESYVLWLTLAMGGWLLQMSNSKTATLCLLMGTVLLIGPKLPRFTPKKILIYGVSLLAVGLVAEYMFQISTSLLALIGRGPTLTNRTEIWKFIAANSVNPLLGTGYLMYWDKMGTFQLQGNLVELQTAHNGYLDIYLDGGWIGVIILAVMLVALGKRMVLGYLDGSTAGRLGFAFFAIMIVYNISESMFARRTPLWFVFLLFCIEPGRAVVQAEEEAVAEPLLVTEYS